jgi:hypothetical protein
MTAFKLYLRASIFGSILNFILFIIIINLLNFDGKSAICIYSRGIPNYFIKSIFFFLIYLVFSAEEKFENKTTRNVIIFTPLILTILWYLSIISFNLSNFYTDISFGYLYHFPHFYIQILTMLITCITTFFLYRKKETIKE